MFRCSICSKCRFPQLQPAIKLGNILQHLEQYATKSKKTVSGLIMSALSNGNGRSFVWAAVTKQLRPWSNADYSCKIARCAFFFLFRMEFFIILELLVLVVVFCAGIRFWYAVSNIFVKTGAATLHIHCGRSVKPLTRGQVTRSGQLTRLKKKIASTLWLQFTYDQYKTYSIAWGHQYL